MRPRVYLDIFNQWDLSLKSFLRNASDSLSPTAQQAARVLQLNQQMLALQIDISTQKDRIWQLMRENRMFLFQEHSPLEWDAHTPRFQQITAMARNVVEHAVRLDAARRDHFRKFALDTNIIATLYFIATSCRDPIVRREAVALLYESPCEEGLWHSAITARVCEKLVDIEEEGLGEVRRCDDIPEWRRVDGITISFNVEGRVGKISYRRRKMPGELEGGDCEEPFQW